MGFPEATPPLVRGLVKRARGLVKESDGKALQNAELRAEGRRLQEEGWAESRAAREHRGQGRRAR